MAQNSGKLSTESYRGVRDFYPHDMQVQRYIFDVMAGVAESFGYEEYGASVLEPHKLYEAKTGQEIVNEQTYTFEDRGGRQVTLRPEMTPTLARMIAAKKRELSFPLRWYSIPNLFRYERPQRGRLREHWQLNVDLFGIETLDADVEIIAIAARVMEAFGAKPNDYLIKINSRKLLDRLYKHYSLSDEEIRKLSKLIDKKEKMPANDFAGELGSILSEKSGLAEIFIGFLRENDLDKLPEGIRDGDERQELDKLMVRLGGLGVKNVVVDTSVVRGFDYYTGIVFEIFDTDPLNSRSLFGGGRYDDLLSLFGSDYIPAVGFGMGDVAIKDFLEAHELVPTFDAVADLFLCTLTKEVVPAAQEIAEHLRNEGISVVVNYTQKKVGDQIKLADKQKIPFVVCVGDEEIHSRTFKVKKLSTGDEIEVAQKDIARFIVSSDQE